MDTGSRKILIGNVLESNMDKTVVVQVAKRFAHPVYKKLVTKTRKYYAHDELNKCRFGDVVRIIESKPISKLKRWRFLDLEKSASQI